MPARPRPAIVTLRMSTSLRDALHAAAAGEGCSLNSYALQILAAAAGDPARFRGDPVGLADEPSDAPRDERGFPLRPRDRTEHLLARRAFFDAMTAERGAVTAEQLVRRHEANDPAFFVEWARRRAS
jgi:HicB family